MCVCVFMRTVTVRVMCAYVLFLLHIIVVRVGMRVKCIWKRACGCAFLCALMRDFLCVYVCACAACMLRVPISAVQVSVCVGVCAFASRVHQVPQKSGAS